MAKTTDDEPKPTSDGKPEVRGEPVSEQQARDWGVEFKGKAPGPVELPGHPSPTLRNADVKVVDQVLREAEQKLPEKTDEFLKKPAGDC